MPFAPFGASSPNLGKKDEGLQPTSLRVVSDPVVIRVLHEFLAYLVAFAPSKHPIVCTGGPELLLLKAISSVSVLAGQALQ